MAIDRNYEAWRKANPWVLVNTQNSQAMCGRYPNREAAEKAANERGGVVAVEGHCVLFSEMPLL